MNKGSESMETKSRETAVKGTDAMTTEAVKARMQSWIDRLHLEVHTEGGWFSEVYAAPAEYGSSKDGRVMGGTIYFFLGQEDISHFHVIASLAGTNSFATTSADGDSCSASWGLTLNAPAVSPRPAGCPPSGSVMAFCSFS